MPFFHDYPYESYHEMNLDWIIGMIKKLTGEMHDFKVVNQITFWGDWDITKQYPAWSVVNNNGDGYISIKPVPVGVDIANTDYWILVANYSALYADMQNRIVALEGDVSTLKNTVATLDIKVNSRKILFIGDSIGTVQGADNKTYFELCGERLGLTQNVTYFTAAFAGIGFCTSLTFPGNFGEAFTWFKTNYPAVDLDTITDVVICGGPNDLGESSADINTAINALVSQIRTDCNNATISIGISSRNSVNSAGVIGFHDYVAAYKSGAINNDCKWLEGLQYALYNNKWTTDHLHPNNDGVSALSTALIESMINGEARVTARLINDAGNVTLGANIASVSNLDLFSEQIDNENVYVSPNSINPTMVVLSSEQSSIYSLDLFTMSDNIILSINNAGIPQQLVMFQWYDNNSQTWQLNKHGWLRKFYDTWKLEILDAPLNNCTQLQIFYPGTVAMSAANC